MSNIFLTADLHLGHEKMISVWKARPFDTLEAMHEALIANHNAIVGPNDLTYMLGDICWKKTDLHLLARMNGRKRLIAGNHDRLKVREYLPYFERVTASKSLDGILLTHIPVHPSCLSRNSMRVNAHGHLHAEKIMLPVSPIVGDRQPVDPRYVCVSVEQWDYTPVPLDILRERVIGFVQ